jgi:hypothetical protein
MPDVLRVQWTIIARTAPQPWLVCRRCGEPRRFRSSDKIRVNANGKRIDAWLIYQCTDCGGAWNRPILERRPVRTIDPDFLASLHTSEPGLTRRLAFDVESLRQRAGRVEEFDDAFVVKSVALKSTMPTVGDPVLGLRAGRTARGSASRKRTAAVAKPDRENGGGRRARCLSVGIVPAPAGAGRDAAGPRPCLVRGTSADGQRFGQGRVECVSNR